MTLVKQDLDSHVALITLNNSEQGNVLNQKSLQAIIQTLGSSIQNRDSRVIVLRSNGDQFCLGMDLSFLQSLDQSTEENRKKADETVSLYVDLLSLIHFSAKPVICVVKGEVKAGGVGLVAACDVVLASEKSTFELSEVFFGLIPANVIPFLLSVRMSPQKIKYLVLTAKKLLAEKARDIGLVDEVFSETEMEKGIKSIIKKLLRASPEALKETKEFINRLSREDIKEASKTAKETLLRLIRNKNVIQAIKDFNEGNTPVWFEKYRPAKPI
ncbi:MAG: enoyl-CoA hydratase/isomerase family protein [Spirochaetes bacterium]|nr:enoyl-CoA hydratase/isomerase family protein [Spirochaetota bacterium]